MKLSGIKKYLLQIDHINFKLPSGEYVPSHYHVTEIGSINKHFMDCGGTERKENIISFQLWTANDLEHRLTTEKLLKVIKVGEEKLHLHDSEIEVEYQSETIGKYSLDFDGKDFILTNKHTTCLANDACGVTPVKKNIQLADIQKQTSCCAPDDACC